MVYGARHPGHAGALVLQSAFGRFDLERVVEEFRRAGGDEVAEIARRSYGREDPPVTPEEWARCWRFFGPWVPGDEELARAVVNTEMVAARPLLIQRFDALADLARVKSPTLVCVGELDPITPVAAARELVAALPDGIARLEILEGAGHFPWRDDPDRYWPLLLGFVAAFAPPPAAALAAERPQ